MCRKYLKSNEYVDRSCRMIENIESTFCRAKEYVENMCIMRECVECTCIVIESICRLIVYLKSTGKMNEYIEGT